MLETYVDPYGKAAFPTRIKCDACGAVITSGTMTDESHHYCQEHSTSANQEFRVCQVCGKPMVRGMTDLFDFYAHEECFETAMRETYGTWRECDDDGLGGYYEHQYDGKWWPTGIFYTEWY